VEDYLEDSSAAQVKVSSSTAAPPIDSAEGDGECVANSTLQAGEGVKDDDNSIIIVYEHEMPRVQWHHPDLYDTIVQVNSVQRPFEHLPTPLCTFLDFSWCLAIAVLSLLLPALSHSTL
jgi:hypothetical protein